MLSHALREILELEQSCGLVAKLFEVCDLAPRCSSAQKQAFNLLDEKVEGLLPTSLVTRSLSSRCPERRRCRPQHIQRGQSSS